MLQVRGATRIVDAIGNASPFPMDFQVCNIAPSRLRACPKNLQQIQGIVDEINIELAPLAALAFDLLVDVEAAIWDQRLCEACPFIDLSPVAAKQRNAQLVILEKWKNGAWTVSFTVDSSEWPTLEAVLLEMAEIASRRDCAITSYIGNRNGTPAWTGLELRSRFHAWIDTIRCGVGWCSARSVA